MNSFELSLIQWSLYKVRYKVMQSSYLCSGEPASWYPWQNSLLMQNHVQSAKQPRLLSPRRECISSCKEPDTASSATEVRLCQDVLLPHHLE